MAGAVTIGFGDLEAGIHGVACEGGGALLLAAGEIRELASPAPGNSGPPWQARVEDALDLVLEPLGDPLAYTDGSQEWLCRVRGKAAGRDLDCLGHRVVAGDSGRTELQRTIAAWLAPDHAFAARAARPRGTSSHEQEALEVFALRGEPPAAAAIGDPRLSTTYDGDGAVLRAGLELWESDESEYALRLGSERIAAGELRLPGGEVVRTAFLRWHHDGRDGAGRYDIA
jgi:hypothetical protein